MKTRINYLILFIIAFTAGAFFEYWMLTDVWPNRHLSYTWLYTLRNHRKFGEPCATDVVLDRQGYSLGYSYTHKSALWASYVISADSVSIDIGRHQNFYSDTDIPEPYRTQLTHYRNTGYDKGHLAPSGSVDFSRAANRETFALSNVVPQHPQLNRQAWKTLEELTRKWTASKGKLYIIAGPVYSAQSEKVNDLLIPDSLYNVIYSYQAGKAIGFLMPNTGISAQDLWQYAMSVHQIETETGLTFFSTLNENTQQQVKNAVDIGWWQAD